VEFDVIPLFLKTADCTTACSTVAAQTFCSLLDTGNLNKIFFNVDRKILVDNNEDKYQKNSLLARRKEEATLEAKHEIKNLILKEMTLKSEVNRLRKRSSWRQEVILEAKHENKNLILGR
jgi:hypothetical protein